MSAKPAPRRAHAAPLAPVAAGALAVAAVVAAPLATRAQDASAGDADAAADAAAPAAPAAPAAAAAAAAARDLRSRLVGTWTHVGGARDQAAYDAALARTTAHFNFLIRGIAEGRIRETNAIPPTVTITFPPGHVRVQYPGRPPLQSRDDGTPGPGVTPQGAPTRVVHQLLADRLVQVSSVTEGARRTEFVPSADGRSLAMRVQVTAPQLPVPFVYPLAYRRR